MGLVTYKFELLPTMRRAHNVLHVSKLKKYHSKKASHELLPIAIDADGTEEYEVRKILDKRKHNRRVYYLVQFEGEPVQEAVWLPKSELSNCRELLQEYEHSMRTSSPKKG